MTEVRSNDPRSPSAHERAFICPHCRAHAQQAWFDILASHSKDPVGIRDAPKLREHAAETEREAARDQDAKLRAHAESLVRLAEAVERGDPGLMLAAEYVNGRPVRNLALSRCFVCERETVWLGGTVLYPSWTASVPPPNLDLSEDVRLDYVEGAKVLAHSPRSACALARLAIQKLCSDVLGSKDDINKMIAELVARGLPVQVRQALDVVRVVGNEAVHPGSLDLRDDDETAGNLFKLVNLIAEHLITQPKHVAAMYAGLPSGKLKAIQDRDAKALPPPKPA